MKKSKQNLAEFAKQLQEHSDGTFNGGFSLILSSSDNAIIIGGEETNNCNGGNCVTGCGTNSVAGCGGTVNNVKGCGTTLVQ